MWKSKRYLSICFNENERQWLTYYIEINPIVRKYEKLYNG